MISAMTASTGIEAMGKGDDWPGVTKSLLIFWILPIIAFCIISISNVYTASADPGVIPLYHYGIGDGKLGKPTAFAESWMRPSWVPKVVRWDWPGIALQDYSPGTMVKLTVMGLPAWADTWPELEELIGRSVYAYVADRPGGDYGDAWWSTFGELAPHWVGVVYARVEVMGQYVLSGY